MSQLWEWPYEHRDEITGSTWLGIEPEPDARRPGFVKVSVRFGQFVSIGDPAPVVAALYGAKGLPAPVILERPEVTFKDGLNRAGPIEVGRLGGRVTVGLYGIQPEEIDPAPARRLAALIAIRADEIQADEPDPAEVEELAAVLDQAGALLITTPTERLARTALKWMRDKQQREGASS